MTYRVAVTLRSGSTGTATSCQGRHMQQRYEYLVITIRAGLVGDAVDHDKVEDALNDKAKDGWQLRTLTAADVKGRVGPGATSGLLATFERPV
jgi:hypothetical protein